MVADGSDVEMEDLPGAERPSEEKSVEKWRADVRELSQSLKNLKVWDIDLAGHLRGFQKAIHLIQTAVPDYDKSKFTLSEAAYAIYNAGNIWAKRVDETCRIALRATEMVSSADSRKSNKETDDAEGKEKRQPRNKHCHPLSLPPDERRDKRFLQARAAQKIPAHRCTAKDFPQLPQDSYLSEVQPRSLGLMEHEKIQAYLDDRGQKGNDWADFRINTVKLTREGYFPMQLLHPDSYERTLPENRPRFTAQWEREPSGGHDDQEDIPVDDGPQEQHNNHHQQPLMENPADEVGRVVDPAPDAPARNLDLSRGRPDRLASLPHMPFTKSISIARLKADRALGPDMDPADVVPPELHAFRMRTKRILQKKPSRHVSTEVEFFQYFWDIPERGTRPAIRLGKVLKRFSQRLRRVETVVPARGRKRKQLHVTFVSNGEAGVGQSSSLECPFAAPDVPDLNFRPSAEPFDDEDGGGADYLETDEPIIPEDHFNDPPLHEGPDPFHELRRDGAFVRPNYHHDGDMEVDDLNDTVTSSQIGNVDLCDWENRLGEFLTVHERNTLSFNLEEFGENLIARSKSIGPGVLGLQGVMRRTTTGDVCRSFLSMLDLANKNKIHFQAGDDRDDAMDGGGGFSLSQGADQMEFVVM